MEVSRTSTVLSGPFSRISINTSISHYISTIYPPYIRYISTIYIHHIPTIYIYISTIYPLFTTVKHQKKNTVRHLPELAGGFLQRRHSDAAGLQKRLINQKQPPFPSIVYMLNDTYIYKYVYIYIYYDRMYCMYL